MAYRLNITAPIGKDVRRLLLGQVRHACGCLSGPKDPVTAIHEARKGLKRSRSILCLIEPGLPPQEFRRLNHHLRDIAQLLSGQRDADVMIETVILLDSGAEPDQRAALMAVSDLLKAKGRAPGAGDNRETISRALGMLQEAAKFVRAMPVTGLAVETVAEGFADTYRRGRRQMRRIANDGGDETVHDLRKAVQHHWRHLQLLMPLWPEVISPRLTSARRIAQCLGDDHDCSVLINALADGGWPVAPKDRDRVAALARCRQGTLRDEALPLARRLFAESAGDMRRFVLRLWPVAAELAEGPHVPAEPETEGPAAGDPPSPARKVAEGSAT